MSDFEKKYYESVEFWKEGILEDSANRQRIISTTELIPKDVDSLVDIGCGNGVFGNYLITRKPDLHVMCIDRSETALGFVKTHKKLGDINQIPLEDGSYDCVTSLQVLEHIPHSTYQTALSELARVSKKYILISVPYNEDLKTNATQCPSCKSIFNADLHLRSYNADTINSLFSKWGYDCVTTKNIIVGQQYIGWKYLLKFRQIISPVKEEFLSPICPICGYEHPHFKQVEMVNGNNKNSIKVLAKSLLKAPIRVLKKVWHKKTIPGYWIVALYRKKY